MTIVKANKVSEGGGAADEFAARPGAAAAAL